MLSVNEGRAGEQPPPPPSHTQSIERSEDLSHTHSLTTISPRPPVCVRCGTIQYICTVSSPVVSRTDITPTLCVSIPPSFVPRNKKQSKVPNTTTTTQPQRPTLLPLPAPPTLNCIVLMLCTKKRSTGTYEQPTIPIPPKPHNKKTFSHAREPPSCRHELGSGGFWRCGGTRRRKV